MNKATLTVKELAEEMSVGYTVALRLTKSEGFYPAFRLGRKILINANRLQQWLDEQTQQEGEAG